MPKTIDITIRPELAENREEIRRSLQSKGIVDVSDFRIVKRSIDARRKPVLVQLRCEIPSPGEVKHPSFIQPQQRNVARSPEVYIIGAGPCGLFAAIELIERGIKPIIIERGKDVRSRRRDLAILNREQIVNPESNYCFGEGGAGTYSDGKLYTRSKKRGSVEKVLHYLVAFGAPPDITIDAHPHIGTNKLPKLIEAMRGFILAMGGEVRFNTKLTDLEIESGVLKRIQLNGSEWVLCKTIVLATGHSARDIFELLYKRGVSIEAKPFALGVRIEHPQVIIDKIQYKCETRGDYLPPASYSLVHQVKDRGVYSFCMCPGGIIAPCATAPGEIVTNGWSPSKRNNPFANSGMVVSIEKENFDPKNTGNPLMALRYQQRVEKVAFSLGGGGQIAPAQRVVDFVEKRISADLPECSYQPGLQSANLDECLPIEVNFRLREALKVFGQKMRGYYTNEAVLVATESRTSSPVRIPRNEDLEHVSVKGIYPAGEGAGYAGGIVSAAIDGQKIAEAIALAVKAG